VETKLVYVSPVVENCRVQLEGIVAGTIIEAGVDHSIECEDYVAVAPMQAPNDILIAY
jgi:hypothetical protein